ncbi:helix-turn-helix transcriptional regulator [Niveispirillum sp. KHB5.9]|uniref:helix-turn-helix transcriptional regulator n=1 Tax=Niveispirillum sp. KHB5.9 TaxID=3400269 RepID=UPI003A87AD5F
MAPYRVTPLLATATVRVLDAVCTGDCDHDPGVDCAHSTYLAFPYRGLYQRQAGDDVAVAEPNQVVFFNAGEPFRITHPVPGGDASLLLFIDPHLLRELPRPEMLCPGDPVRFTRQRLRIDPRATALTAMLRYSLLTDTAEPLEAESLALTLAQRALGPRTSHAADARHGQQRLVDRIKLALSADLSRRWTLAEIAAEVGGSPVYLTQLFRQVEGVPLYRYQTRLRLARALDLIAEYEDLTALGLELGFSSHSHFTAAFRQAYGRSPTEFRQSVLKRPGAG